MNRNGMNANMTEWAVRSDKIIMVCTHPDKKSNYTLHISIRLLDLRKFSADGPEDGMSGQHPAKILFSMGMKLATRSF